MRRQRNEDVSQRHQGNKRRTASDDKDEDGDDSMALDSDDEEEEEEQEQEIQGLGRGHRRLIPSDNSQGQTFQEITIYLSAPVFAHGQLYVGLSRVGPRKSPY